MKNRILKRFESRLFKIKVSLADNKQPAPTPAPSHLRMKFYQKFLPLEAEFSNFCPGESFNFGRVLEDGNAGVDNCQAEGNTILILKSKVKLVKDFKI